MSVSDHINFPVWYSDRTGGIYDAYPVGDEVVMLQKYIPFYRQPEIDALGEWIAAAINEKWERESGNS